MSTGRLSAATQRKVPSSILNSPQFFYFSPFLSIHQNFSIKIQLHKCNSFIQYHLPGNLEVPEVCTINATVVDFSIIQFSNYTVVEKIFTYDSSVKFNGDSGCMEAGVSRESSERLIGDISSRESRLTERFTLKERKYRC